jgi:hypothetical protein
MDQHPDTWTGEGVKGGLIRFYRGIAGVGLVFPRADRPIAVEFPGYPVVRLRRIEGLEFVEEAVIALGSSTRHPDQHREWNGERPRAEPPRDHFWREPGSH